MSDRQSVYDKAIQFLSKYEGFEAGIGRSGGGHVEREHAAAFSAARELVTMLLGDDTMQLQAPALSQTIAECASLLRSHSACLSDCPMPMTLVLMSSSDFMKKS
jgi:hypothetical protein